MRTERFVRGLKYDAIPRTTVPIELFNSESYAPFDTTLSTESQHVNCTEHAVITLKGLQPAVGRPCRTEPSDS